MKYSYTPYGVCSRKIDIDIEDGIIKDCVLQAAVTAIQQA